MATPGNHRPLPVNSTKTVKPVAKPSGTADSSAELAYWNSIKNSTNKAEFQSYLNTFKTGVFRELAKVRIKTLE